MNSDPVTDSFKLLSTSWTNEGDGRCKKEKVSSLRKESWILSHASLALVSMHPRYKSSRAKKQAVTFARTLGLTENNVVRGQTRFMVGWLIFCQVGRGYLSRQTELLGD